MSANTGKDAKKADDSSKKSEKKSYELETFKYVMRVKRIEQLRLPLSNEKDQQQQKQQSKSATTITATRSNNTTPSERGKTNTSNNTLTRVGKLRRSNGDARQASRRRPTTAPVRNRTQYKNEDEQTLKTMVGICRERSQEKGKSNKTNLSSELKKLTINNKAKSNENIENNNKSKTTDKLATAPQQQQQQQQQQRNTVLLDPPLALISRRIPKYNKFLSRHELYDGYGYHLIDNKGASSIEKKVYHRKNIDNYVRSLVSWHRFKYINRLTK